MQHEDNGNRIMFMASVSISLNNVRSESRAHGRLQADLAADSWPPLLRGPNGRRDTYSSRLHMGLKYGTSRTKIRHAHPSTSQLCLA